MEARWPEQRRVPLTSVISTLGPSSSWSKEEYGLTSSVGVSRRFWVNYAMHPDRQPSPHLVV